MRARRSRLRGEAAKRLLSCDTRSLFRSTRACEHSTTSSCTCRSAGGRGTRSATSRAAASAARSSSCRARGSRSTRARRTRRAVHDRRVAARCRRVAPKETTRAHDEPPTLPPRAFSHRSARRARARAADRGAVRVGAGRPRGDAGLRVAPRPRLDGEPRARVHVKAAPADCAPRPPSDSNPRSDSGYSVVKATPQRR